MWLICSLSVPEYFNNKPHIHFPLIQTKAVFYDVHEMLSLANKKEALLFSSKEAVRYFLPVLKKLQEGKIVFCVGPQTAHEVQKHYKGKILIPTSHDQEGLVDLIKQTAITSIVYPRAKKIRPYLKKHLSNISICELVCYETQTASAAELPSIDISGYYFASPSNVKAYHTIFGMPLDLPILVKGHVTLASVKKVFKKETFCDVIAYNAYHVAAKAT